MKSILLILVFLFHYSVFSQIVSYPGPAGEAASVDYKVKLNNKTLFVYQARVSAMPVNVWPGINRPLEQTEIASFCYFDIKKETTITIQSTALINNVVIRPLSFKIRPVIRGNTISFKISGPTQIVVEVNGWHKALHLFANPIEKGPFKKSEENVLYFGPGNHYPGVIHARNNQTIFIAGGAVVHGAIYGNRIKNLKIRGRGIIDASTFKRGVDSITIMQFEHCQNVSVEGIILRDAHIWSLMAHECNNLKISNIKIIGMWRYNTDGIDIVNSKNVIIENSFVRAFDDCIVIGGAKSNYFAPNSAEWDSTSQSNVSNIVVKNCVIWNDWGRALEIGALTVADSINKILYKNIDIIHYVHIAMDIQNGNRAHVSDVIYDNIRVEDPIFEDVYLDDLNNPIRDLEQVRKTPGNTYKFKLEEIGRLFEINIRDNGWAKDIGLGTVNNIYFKNIHYYSLRYIPKSFFQGFSPEHEIKNVGFQNIYINGIKITNISKSNFSLNEFVKNLYFK